MPRNRTIAGMPIEDYYLIYRLITCGFSHVLRQQKERGYIPPSKVCNVNFETLKEIYKTLKDNYPHLFDKDGAIIRKINKKKKKEIKKSLYREESKVILLFD